MRAAQQWENPVLPLFYPAVIKEQLAAVMNQINAYAGYLYFPTILGILM
jgi:hypothetical protein